MSSPPATEGWASIRPMIVEKLKGVPGIGRVHRVERHSNFWKQYHADHIHDGRVNSWCVTRRGMNNQFDDVGDRQIVGCIFRREHVAQIRGRYSVDEGSESEVAFQDLVDLVVSAFEADVLLGGKLKVGAPPIVESVGHQMYGGVLVHEAQILFTATERVSR